ncbi:MAG: DsrE family protein [Flavobacteriales bacterium]|nr:DsrE family protein [Flavobacteriales bacterium]
MRTILLLLTLVCGMALPAQDGPRQHRIVMQLTSGDTLVHKNLMKQVKNMLEASPTARIDVVCHGPGMDMLMTDRSTVQAKVKEFVARGVAFTACDNTIRERQLDPDRVMPEAGHVKAGIIHIVERQEDGWSYIKAGF